YFRTLEGLIQNATRRVFLDTLSIDDSPITSLMKRRANDGIPTRLKLGSKAFLRTLVDPLSEKVIKGMRQDSPVQVERSRRYMKWYESWQRTVPFMGIHHGKSFIVDDTAGLGGMNLDPRYTSMIDFMILTTNPSIVSALEEYFLHSGALRKDTEIPCDNQSSLLVDIGRPFCSTIQRRALDLIDSAEREIVIISQYYPEGRVHKALHRKATAGVDVKVVVPYADYDLTHSLNRVMARTSRGFRIHPAYDLIKLKHYVHAKGLVVDRKHALAGSHNITAPTNNYLGLTEVALDTKDEQLVRGICDFISQSMLLS
ncbi:MAG: phospholipase D-like domain-containing protein, partial [Candidatus Roizmanbacteria bacterium]